MRGGAHFSKDGGMFSMPPARFTCSGGRKGDALCALAGILKSSAMEDFCASVVDDDPIVAAWRGQGYTAWAIESRRGRKGASFKAAMTIACAKTAERLDAGARDGVAEMKRARANADTDIACLTIWPM